VLSGIAQRRAPLGGQRGQHQPQISAPTGTPARAAIYSTSANCRPCTLGCGKERAGD
jgi:hypothetical protein